MGTICESKFRCSYSVHSQLQDHWPMILQLRRSYRFHLSYKEYVGRGIRIKMMAGNIVQNLSTSRVSMLLV